MQQSVSCDGRSVKKKKNDFFSFIKMNDESCHHFDQLVALCYISKRQHSYRLKIKYSLNHSKSSKYKVEATCALFLNNIPEHFLCMYKSYRFQLSKN